MAERKVVLYIAESLDGYIATKEDSLDWLFSITGEGDNGYGEFLPTVDTIIMGRRTYDWVMEAEKVNFPYKGKECYVFSKTQKGKNEFVEFIDTDAAAFVNNLRKQEGKNIWIVGGEKVIDTFMKAQLIDEYIITIAPILIGNGIPLFSTRDFEQKLTLTGVRTFGQFTELHLVR